jgi:hypothetical protein
MKQRVAGLGMAVVGVLLIAACSSGRPSSAPTTTATTAPNPDVIPAVITPAYVDAVFRVLEHVDGNASRELIAAKAVTPQVLADIRAIYNDPLYAQEVQIARQSLQGDLSNVRPSPGDVVVSVQRIIGMSPTCVLVETTSDFSAVVYKSAPPSASEYWQLTPKQPSDDPSNLNGTPWALAFNADYTTPTSISNKCASS